MCGRADYLVAIRGFMLTYQVSLRFDNAQSFSNLSDYGSIMIHSKENIMRYLTFQNL